MYHIQSGGYASGLLAMGQMTSVLHPNDKASHMALPCLVVETTPCHLSSFLLFSTTPVTCPTHCFLMDWLTFPGSQSLVSLSLYIHVIRLFLTFF
jgi:hypothetical protein